MNGSQTSLIYGLHSWEAHGLADKCTRELNGGPADSNNKLNHEYSRPIHKRQNSSTRRIQRKMESLVSGWLRRDPVRNAGIRLGGK